MKNKLWRSAGLIACATAMLATTATFAEAAPGGGGEVETGFNNLSVPTLVLGGVLEGASCLGVSPKAASELVAPTGDPLTGFSLDPSAYYYVQGNNVWQAQCYTATLTKVTAAWGDNLAGAASLTTKHPIRVELALTNAALWRPALQGYTVVKLQEELADRYSAYGTPATDAGGGAYEATPTTFKANEQRVYDAAAVFFVRNLDTGKLVVPYETKAPAEINATGNVVYGYNLVVDKPGRYAIRFRIPSVKILGSDVGTYSLHHVRLVITVK